MSSTLSPDGASGRRLGWAPLGASGTGAAPVKPELPRPGRVRVSGARAGCRAGRSCIIAVQVYSESWWTEQSKALQVAVWAILTRRELSGIGMGAGGGSCSPAGSPLCSTRPRSCQGRSGRRGSPPAPSESSAVRVIRRPSHLPSESSSVRAASAGPAGHRRRASPGSGGDARQPACVGARSACACALGAGRGRLRLGGISGAVPGTSLGSGHSGGAGPSFAEPDGNLSSGKKNQ